MNYDQDAYIVIQWTEHTLFWYVINRDMVITAGRDYRYTLCTTELWIWHNNLWKWEVSENIKWLPFLSTTEWKGFLLKELNLAWNLEILSTSHHVTLWCITIGWWVRIYRPRLKWSHTWQNRLIVSEWHGDSNKNAEKLYGMANVQHTLWFNS